MPLLRVKPAFETVYVRDAPVGEKVYHTQLDCPKLHEGPSGALELWACQLVQENPDGTAVVRVNDTESERPFEVYPECRDCEYGLGTTSGPVEYMPASHQ